MRINRTFTVITLLAAVVAVSVAATGAGTGGPEFKNLQVLPKNTSSKTLSHIMVDDFEDGLGVPFNFYHAEEKGSHRLDYASDANPMKSEARKMMRMAMKINRKYFLVKHPLLGDPSMVVNCVTCHN